MGVQGLSILGKKYSSACRQSIFAGFPHTFDSLCTVSIRYTSAALLCNAHGLKMYY